MFAQNRIDTASSIIIEDLTKKKKKKPSKSWMIYFDWMSIKVCARRLFWRWNGNSLSRAGWWQSFSFIESFFSTWFMTNALSLWLILAAFAIVVYANVGIMQRVLPFLNFLLSSLWWCWVVELKVTEICFLNYSTHFYLFSNFQNLIQHFFIDLFLNFYNPFFMFSNQ